MDHRQYGKLQQWGAPILIFISSAALIGFALFLWQTHNGRAQGAAIALVGVTATHLVKEIQELLRAWLSPVSPAKSPDIAPGDKQPDGGDDHPS